MNSNIFFIDLFAGYLVFSELTLHCKTACSCVNFSACFLFYTHLSMSVISVTQHIFTFPPNFVYFYNCMVIRNPLNVTVANTSSFLNLETD